MPQNTNSDSDHQAVDQFVSQVRSRLNRHLAAYLAWSVTLCAGLCLLFIGMFYILQGHAVPMFWYPTIAIAAVLVHLLILSVKHVSHMQAAHLADDYFHLKDTVASALGLSERDDDFCKLQAAQAHQKVSKLKPQSITFDWPRRTIATALCLLVCVTLVGFKAESPQVRQQREMRQRIAAGTQEVNELLEELAEELLSIDEKQIDLDVDTKASLKDLQKQAQQMQTQQDLKVAMTQYAQLEQQVHKLMAKLDTKPAEKMLEKIGEQLKQDPQHRKLGQELANKQYKQAKASLAEHKQNRKLSKEQQKKALEKLKSLAANMARSAESANKSGNSAASGSNSNGQNDSGMSGQISKSIAELEQAADKYDKLEKQQSLNKNSDAQSKQACQSACQSCNRSLSKLGQCFSKLSGQRKLNQRLAKMRKSLSQCQSFLAQCNKPGQCQSLAQCMSPGSKGGLKAGSASAGLFNRTEQSLLQAGVMDQITGLKGQGPSSKSTEQASEGSGVSSDSRRVVKRDYKRELESFVQREDVPVPVRSGVKQYFENIHQMDHEVISDSN